VSNLAYFVLAQVGKNYSMLVLTINIENFCAGLGTAAFVAFLMSLCNPALLSNTVCFTFEFDGSQPRYPGSTGWDFGKSYRLAFVFPD
jgi:hypothetical protein